MFLFSLTLIKIQTRSQLMFRIRLVNWRETHELANYQSLVVLEC